MGRLSFCEICGGKKKPQSKYCHECSNMQHELYHKLKLEAYAKAFRITKQRRGMPQLVRQNTHRAKRIKFVNSWLQKNKIGGKISDPQLTLLALKSYKDGIFSVGTGIFDVKNSLLIHIGRLKKS